jgi:DNA repair exonuclease SbcCD ATPase subunit
VAVFHRRAVGTSRDVPALQEGFSVGPSSFRGSADEASESLSEQTNSDNALALPKKVESLSGPAGQPDTRGNERFFEAADLSRYRALYHVQLHTIKKLEIEKIDLDAANKMLQYQTEALGRANKRLQDQSQTKEVTIQELQDQTQAQEATIQELQKRIQTQEAIIQEFQKRIQAQEATNQELQKLTQTFTAIRQSLDPSDFS